MQNDESENVVPIVDIAAKAKEQEKKEQKNVHQPTSTQELTRPVVYEEKFSYDRFSTIKSAAVGLLDVALIVESASLIRRVVGLGPNTSWFLPMLILLSIQLGLEVVEGILLLVLGTQNLENPSNQVALKRTNILSTVLAALIAILNFIVQQIIGEARIYAPVNMTHTSNTLPIPLPEGSGF